MVGLPGFEPGTSCTPSKKYQSLTKSPHWKTKDLMSPEFGRQNGRQGKLLQTWRLDSTETPEEWRIRRSLFFVSLNPKNGKVA